jgi:hypothetical protein
LQKVGPVHTRGDDIDDDLATSGDRLRQIGDPECLRTSWFGRDHRPHA